MVKTGGHSVALFSTNTKPFFLLALCFFLITSVFRSSQLIVAFLLSLLVGNGWWCHDDVGLVLVL